MSDAGISGDPAPLLEDLPLRSGRGIPSTSENIAGGY